MNCLKMKDLNYKDLIGYATSFVAIVLPKIEVDEIILFGSVARQEADKTSDIDLFFNIKEKSKEKMISNEIKKELEKFYKSKTAEIWQLKGITNPIKVETGKLDEWKLKRSIISEGIVLYGKYKGVPEKIIGFTYFNIKPIKDITKRNRIIRNLFGREEKTYSKKGTLENLNGKKLSPLSFILPIEHSQKIINFLNKEKIDFSFFEFWTDQII